MTPTTTCTCGAQDEVTRLRDELAKAKANVERLTRQIREEERENLSLRRRLCVGGR